MLMSLQGQDKGDRAFRWPGPGPDSHSLHSQEPQGYLQQTWQKWGWGVRQEGGSLYLISAASQAFNLCLCVSLCPPCASSLMSAGSLLPSLCLHL